MMGFTWSEIKKWAVSQGLAPNKSKSGVYTWEGVEYAELDSLVTALWNKVSNNKWLEYQKGYIRNEEDR